MDLTRFAIDNRVLTFVVLAAIALAGITAYQSLPRAEDPGFLIRSALVKAPFPGAAPSQVEQLVTDKLEKAIQEIPEVEHISSESRTGLSIITVELREDVSELRQVWDSLRRKVAATSDQLPQGVNPEVDDELGEVFGTVLAITADGFSYSELERIANQVRNALLQIDDVAQVEIHGLQAERIFIDIDNSQLARLGLSSMQLQNTLQTSNIVISGGAVDTGIERMTLAPTGNFNSIEDIRRTLITIPATGETIYLGDIATVRRSYIDPPISKTRVNGLPSLVLAISMRQGGNIIEMGESIKASINSLQNDYPIGIDFEFLAFQPDVVDRAISTFVTSILQAIGIVLVCMLLFLGLRSGLVVATLVPMTMLATLALMEFFEIGLDKMSLVSLILALGLLVDNAIVMSESILVRMQDGESPQTAALASAKELRIPLLISSLTTIAAFLPIVLAESAVGEYTAPLAQVIALALLSSWLLATTMIPLLCILFLKVKGQSEQADSKQPESNESETSGEVAESITLEARFRQYYRQLLVWLLKKPLLTVVGALGLLVVALGLFRFVEQSFFPASNEVLFTGKFEFPYGTSFSYTERSLLDIEGFIERELTTTEDRSGIDNWGIFIGSSAPRFSLNYPTTQGHAGYATLVANASSVGDIEGIFAKLYQYVASNHPDIETTLEKVQTGPGASSPIEVRIYGEDQSTLFELAAEVKEHLRTLSGTRNISDSWGKQTKKLVVNIDEEQARRVGITNQEIAISLRTALSGTGVTEFREDDKAIPVVLRSNVGDQNDIAQLEALNVYAASGLNVALRQVADIELVFEPSKVLRRDRTKVITVLSDIDPNSKATPLSTAISLQDWLEQHQANWPSGYSYEIGGTFESSSSANESILVKMPIAAFFILILLVGQFNSIRKPLIIIFTIPLSFIGVTLGLLLTGEAFGFMTLLGVISLAGIVINNAIVLIDRIQIEMIESGLEPYQAVITAAQQRMRPIILTTATTVGGLLPLWIGGDPLFVSMAVAMMFGLLIATFLTLGVVPALYCLLFRLREPNLLAIASEHQTS